MVKSYYMRYFFRAGGPYGPCCESRRTYRQFRDKILTFHIRLFRSKYMHVYTFIMPNFFIRGFATYPVTH